MGRLATTTVKPDSHGRILGFSLIVLAACLWVVLAPTRALARDYDMSQVDIDATLEPDGTLNVVEDRMFSFDGSFNGVYWKIPQGTYEGRDLLVEVESAGVVRDGTYQPFIESDFGSAGTYELTDYGSYLQVKLYNPADDEDVVYRVSYRIPQLATAWEDTGELYWKFVSDGWDETSEDVTCTIHLPVPSGQTVTPEGNVRAWGHGTLDGSVAFQGDDVVFKVPAVGTDDFAEARILFPVDWLTEPTNGIAHEDDALAEERRWADEANAKREAIRGAITATGVGVLGVSALSLVASIRAKLRYKAHHTAQFQDLYFRDVPSKDHPAVLGCLWEKGTVGDGCFTASLMELTDKGAIELSHVRIPPKGTFGREKEDYLLRRNPAKEAQLTDAIDDDLMHLLFSVIAPKAKGYEKATDGRTRLYSSQMKKVASKYPERFVNGVNDWKDTVEAEAESRGFFTDEVPTGKGLVILMLVLDFLAMMGGFFMLLVWDAPLPWFLALLVPIAAIIVAVWALTSTKGYSQEAIELRAKMEALRRWLKDFTNLDDAPPTDVVLWNRLLVMAVVLGVADEVIAQLKVAMPEIIDDPAFMPTYVWYVGHGHLGSPASVLGDTYHSSYQASMAQVASSSNSSGGGGGGGFSGGGGGGFGGGGGGGAF